MHTPKGTGNQLVAMLERIPVEHRDSWRLHRVGPGETLASIAKSYGVSANAIAAANHVSSADQAEDGRLLIPAVVRAEPAPRRAAVRTASSRSSGARSAAVRGKSGGRAAASARRATSRPATVSSVQRKRPVVVASASSR